MKLQITTSRVPDWDNIKWVDNTSPRVPDWDNIEWVDYTSPTTTTTTTTTPASTKGESVYLSHPLKEMHS